MQAFFKTILLCLFITQFVNCKKDVTNPALPVTASALAGDFTVGSFTNTTNQTSIFNGFVFTFKENGTIVATNGTETVNGTWKFDDSDNSELKINFPVAPLNELNKGWHIESLTDDRLVLTDDGNENEDANDDHPSGSSRLEFERD